MADVAVSTQLQQWSFGKTTMVRPERSSSQTSSPDMSRNDPETLRLDAAVEGSESMDSKDTQSFQERYLSSEEDLSPMEGTSDFEYDEDDVSIHEVQQECLSARKLSVSRWDKGKSCDTAVMVSYVSAGRPKVINLATDVPPISPMPERENPQRSASLAQLPMTAISKLRKADESSRLSMRIAPSATRSASPAVSSIDSRRPSTGHAPYSYNNGSPPLSDSSSSFKSASSTRSSSPASDKPTRPASAAAIRQPRSSLYITSTASRGSPTGPLTPLTPLSPEPHSFLSSDPYENSTTNAASPIIKNAPHKRLRSISQKLSLAKIAITPSTKKWDSRVNGKPTNMPPTPATPYTPITPQAAPLNGASSPMNRLRRNSRISRPPTGRGPSPEVPPVPTVANPSPRKPATHQKLVARGANEREDVNDLLSFLDNDAPDPASSIKSRRIRKRKSLMDLL